MIRREEFGKGEIRVHYILLFLPVFLESQFDSSEQLNTLLVRVTMRRNNAEGTISKCGAI